MKRIAPLPFFLVAGLVLGACGDDRIAGSVEGPDAIGDVLADAGEDGGAGDAGDDGAVDVPLIDTATPDITKPGGDGDPGSDGADAGPGGGAGAPCDGAADCASGHCVTGPDGRECAGPCDGGACPDGYACVELDDASVCAPRFATYCRPCTEDAECASAGGEARCVTLGDEGAFCGGACETSADCPDDSSCEAVTTLDGSAVSSCVPTAGECACNGAAIADGATTACHVTNEHGSCEGTRACGTEGLGPCSAAAPAAEACNGADDDCDGAIDEGLGGAACTLTNEAGECPGTTACVDGAEACEGQPAAPESCNGADDDCDGSTDEDWPGVGAPCDGPDSDDCPDGLLACDGTGTGTVCEAQGPTDIAEACNGVDDDCDGATDEDWPALGAACDGPDADACEGGVVACAPDEAGTACVEAGTGAVELCNGADDDCDGAADEEWPELGTPCDGPDEDECATGTWACAPDGTGAVCADEAPVGDEVCNGLDDDCDGAIDEDWPTLGEPCDGPDADLCANGVEVCGGAGTTCDEDFTVAETCNGEDDDCDGAVDEDWPTLGDACDGPDEDACATGTLTCGPGGALECMGDGTPSEEICDGADNDCDGEVDEGCAPTSVMTTFAGAALWGQTGEATGGLVLKAGVGLPQTSAELASPGAAWSVQLGLYATTTAAPTQ